MLILDVECYSNFFMVGCLDTQTNVVRCFQPDDLPKFKRYLEKYQPQIITFNGLHYDLRLLLYAFHHLHEPNLLTLLKDFSDFIITAEPGDPRRAWYNEFWWNDANHIDLKQVLGGKLVPSLKKLSYRLQFEELESLPIDPAAILTEEQKQTLIRYNVVDLRNTLRLYDYCQEHLALRQSLTDIYKINCMSLSDSQIAERVIGQNAPRQTSFDCRHPRSMSLVVKKDDYAYQTKQLQDFYQRLINLKLKFEQSYDPIKEKPIFKKFFYDAQQGTPEARKSTAIKIEDIDPKVEFRFGGLHSVHSKPLRGTTAYDLDVTSFYPNLILKHKIYPTGIGTTFLSRYKEILDRRVKAKEEGNKIEANALKIVLNSTFGKFNEFFSKLRDPLSGVSVCLNGELSILRLMDLCFQASNPVLLVNTDGIVCRYDPTEVVKTWQDEMKMNLEVKEITSYFVKDSNNHLLKYKDGTIKIKGAAFAHEKDIAKQNSYPVINKAIVAHILHGIPLEVTIRQCQDVHLFLNCYAKGHTIEQIKLATKPDEPGDPCPTVSRYYLSTESQQHIYKKNKKSWIKVADTEGIKLYNKITTAELPPDLNVQLYVDKANTKLRKILK